MIIIISFKLTAVKTAKQPGSNDDFSNPITGLALQAACQVGAWPAGEGPQMMRVGTLAAAVGGLSVLGEAQWWEPGLGARAGASGVERGRACVLPGRRTGFVMKPPHTDRIQHLGSDE